MLNKTINEVTEKDIAEEISTAYGVEIDPEKVVEIPSDGCQGHMLSGPWRVFAARMGEFTILAHVFKSDDDDVNNTSDIILERC